MEVFINIGPIVLGYIEEKWEEGNHSEESWETSFRILRRWGHENRLEIVPFPKNHRAKKYGWKWLILKWLNKLLGARRSKLHLSEPANYYIIVNKVKGRRLSGLSTRNESVVNSGSSSILNFIACYFLLTSWKEKLKLLNLVPGQSTSK